MYGFTAARIRIFFGVRLIGIRVETVSGLPFVEVQGQSELADADQTVVAQV